MHSLTQRPVLGLPGNYYNSYAYSLNIYPKIVNCGKINKSPTEWDKNMSDEVLTTALLDRLLYYSEVIKLDGNSYRMENRKTIFEKKKEV